MSIAASEAPTWSAARWARVLDRVEFRRPDVGLRFWSPPVWLEVTMTGPDADRWPSTDGPDREWNWQSSHPCVEAMTLAASGAGDDRVLAAIGRYTVENLVLNATHEIGEWLRLDGRRILPAHPERACPDNGSPVADDIDGNGPVHLEFGYPPPADPCDPLALGPTDGLPGLDDRIRAVVASSRFTYLPRTSVSYEPAGPLIAGPDGPASYAAWSTEVLHLVGAPLGTDHADRLVDAVAADVHRALVHYEADRVCRALHVDGHGVWTVTPDRSRRRDAHRDADGVIGPALQALTITIIRTDAAPSVRPAPHGPMPAAGA